MSNKPFALELRLWLHHGTCGHSASAAAASASAASSSASPSSPTASASASDRTLLLFPLAVKISARSVEKKTNVYQPLERVWVRAQREEEDEEKEDESSDISAQSVKKDASSTESPARHPRAAHHVKVAQNGNIEVADDDEGGSSSSDKDEESSDRSSIEPTRPSAKAQATAATTSAASPQFSPPFLPPAITSTLKSPLSKGQKAAKGPLFKPLYLKKGAANSKSAREEYRDRSIGTASIKIKRPLDVKAKATELSATELISQLHVSYVPLKRGGDAGLLVHVLTKGGASEKRPRQK